MKGGLWSHQQQQAAVLSDGAAAAQEAQHHDDDADGDHQVDTRKRLGRDLKNKTQTFLQRNTEGRGTEEFPQRLTAWPSLLTFM